VDKLWLYHAEGDIALVARHILGKGKRLSKQMKRTALKRSTKPLKRTPLKRKSKSKLSTLRRKADETFNRYIRARDGRTCISCGRVGEVDAGHFIATSVSARLRYNEHNVNSQCRRCNRFMHGNLADYAVALTRKYGPEILEKLHKEKQIICQRTQKDYEEIISTYTEKIKHL
jgi:5-methylcytosine-specific restriction endonuclease McrA